MPDITVVTYDWVPESPRGFVRDIRLCWALEEAGLPYTVKTTPFKDRGPEHLAHQPFNQVPWLTHGDVSIFESGAILLYLGGLSEKLMPADPLKRLEVTQWLFAAQASVEAASQPWSFFHFMKKTGEGPMWTFFDNFVQHRLKHLEGVLTNREWLVETFTVADILMADVLRMIDRFDGLAAYPACRAYMRRATARPPFVKAYTDQMARFAA
jgi:glutathione S-transferase